MFHKPQDRRRKHLTQRLRTVPSVPGSAPHGSPRPWEHLAFVGLSVVVFSSPFFALQGTRDKLVFHFTSATPTSASVLFERINLLHPRETESLVNAELPVAAPVRGSTRRGRSCHIRRPARRS